MVIRIRLVTLDEMTGRHSNQLNYRINFFEKVLMNFYNTFYKLIIIYKKAIRTGFEPATSAVTGRHSNQLNYRIFFML